MSPSVAEASTAWAQLAVNTRRETAVIASPMPVHPSRRRPVPILGSRSARWLREGSGLPRMTSTTMSTANGTTSGQPGAVT